MSKKTTAIKGIEQGRAAFSYSKVGEAIEAFDGKSSKDARKYKSYTKKIPMLVKNNGLGATLAFVKSKKDRVYSLIYAQLGAWLCQYDQDLISEEDDLAKQVISMSSPEYRAVTLEVLSLYNWWRRFVEGMIEGEVDDE